MSNEALQAYIRAVRYMRQLQTTTTRPMGPIPRRLLAAAEETVDRLTAEHAADQLDTPAPVASSTSSTSSAAAGADDQVRNELDVLNAPFVPPDVVARLKLDR